MSGPSLKRPRSSNPPSPSTSNSSKRAASEDPLGSMSENGRSDTNGLLSPTMQAMAAGSSPLRKESDNDEAGWVKKTEDFHLSSSDGREPNGDAEEVEEEEEDENVSENFKEQYPEILAAMSPPFKAWEKYYIIPASLLENLKILAMGESGKTSASPLNVEMDVTPLLDDPQDEVDSRLWQIDTVKSGDKTELGTSMHQEPIWGVKPGLVENEDFVFISEEGWKKWIEWYGPENGPNLARFCRPGQQFEMTPPQHRLAIVQRSGDPAPAHDNEMIHFSLPTATPLKIAQKALSNLLASRMDDPEAPIRLWISEQFAVDLDTVTDHPGIDNVYMSPSFLVDCAQKLLPWVGDHDERTWAEVGVEHLDTIVVEIGKISPVGQIMWAVTAQDGKAVPNDQGMTVPSAPPPLFAKPAFFGGSGSQAESSKAASSSSTSNRMETRSQTQKTSRKGKGLVGLQNLGNTCFMNSAVQCLSNTAELSEYFLSGVYTSELNRDNPLGMGGAIAESFGGVIENLWAGGQGSFSPRTLKFTTSRFAPQFAGYGQHDTQEFIAFLLDGLHEDLNRIQKKPYVEKPDWKPGGGDQELVELGKECWDGYKKRNDSVIVDLFQGQLKSTLVCPVCEKESITLDPFMYLTVPLPIAQTRVFNCFFVPLDTEKQPVRVSLLIPQNASFTQVKEKLGALMQCNPKNLVGIDLWKAAIYRFWLDPEHNAEAKNNDDVVWYELPVPVSATPKAVGTTATDGSVTVPVYTVRSLDSTTSHRHYRDATPSDCVSQPFFITLTKAQATDPIAVREAITRGYSRLVKADAREDLWVPSGSREAAVPLPSLPIEEEEKVAEIHLDNGEARVVEVPAQTSQSSDTTSTIAPEVDSPSASTILRKNHSSTSLKSMASTRTGKLVPRGDLFKVHVADASSSETASSFSMFKGKEDVAPFYKAQNASSAASSLSLLENRRKARKGVLGHLAAGVKSFVSTSYASDDEPSPPATPVSPPPVIRPGEGIFCEWPWSKFSEYFDVTEMGEEVVDPAIAKELARKKEGKSISIDDCLDEFSKEETLGQEDLWYCPQCKDHRAATKKLEIYQAPDILVICIKRFGSSRRLHDKLDNLVNFPIDGLDLTDRIGERQVLQNLKLTDEQAKEYGIEPGGDPILYDLYAVDNHFGGMGGGHYTAFCRNKLDGQWYNYDDSRVSRASPEAVQSRAAYLLFYRRRTNRPIGGISRIKAEEASRAASPVPTESSEETQVDDEPIAGPSTDRDLASQDTEALPSYSQARDPSMPSSPNLPSPALSSEGESDLHELPDSEIPVDGDLGEAGTAVGFGNTAWSSSAPPRQLMSNLMNGVYRPLELQSVTPSTESRSEDITRFPTPPGSDDDYEKVHEDQTTVDTNAGSTTLVDERLKGQDTHAAPASDESMADSRTDGDYEMVGKSGSEEDVEMVEKPNHDT